MAKASVKKAAAKKAVKKAVTKKAVSKKAVSKKAVKKASVKKAAARKKKQVLTNQERYVKISEAAYHLAEAHDFAPGSEMDNWLKAEQHIDEWIKKAGIIVKD